MSLTLGNNIAETTVTTGTGDYLLAGVVSAGYRPFGDVGNGGLTLYKVENSDKTKSEWGIGTYNSGTNTLSRTTVLGNYLGTTAAINWTSGTKNIYSPPLVEMLNWITFSNSATISALKLAESSSPSTPASGFASLYVKTDGKLYLKDDAGTETDLTAGATLDSLSDVVITSPASGQVIRHNGTNWVNASLATAGIQPLDATLTAFAALTIAANTLTIGTGADAFSQTTFAANTFPARASTGDLVAKSITDFGLSLIDDADASAARTTLGLVIGANVQAYDAELAAIAGLTSAADKLPYFTGSGTAATTDMTSFARTILDDANGAAVRTTIGAGTGNGDLVAANNLSDVANASTSRTNLGLAIGTNVQAYHATLADIAGASWAQGDVIYHNGSNLVRLAAGTNGQFLKTQGSGANPLWATLAGGGDLLSANNLSDVASATTSRTNLGVGTGDSPQFAAINLGHASDTTISRTGAGAIAVEGVDVALNSTSLSHTASTIELGHASDTTLSRAASGVLAVEGVTVPTISSTSTLTNKRITKRVQSVTDAATITPNADDDDVVDITAIAQAFTLANPSGTPTNMQVLQIAIKDDGTGRAITYGANYAEHGITKKSTTTANKKLSQLWQYRTANSLNKWLLMAQNEDV